MKGSHKTASFCRQRDDRYLAASSRQGKQSTILQDLHLANGLGAKPYAVLTLHRPANVDDRLVFSKMLDAFIDVSRRMPIIFPAHPRTVKRIQDEDLSGYFVDHFVQGPDVRDSRPRIRLVPPLGYLDFLRLMSQARVVLTDSGGIQEETTILGVSCITLRDSTERPVTIEHGTNVPGRFKSATDHHRIRARMPQRRNTETGTPFLGRQRRRPNHRRVDQ